MHNTHEARDSLTSSADLERRIRPDHPLRVVREGADAALPEISAELEALFPQTTSRALISPEQLLRALLLQALHSIPSESQLIERIDLDLLFRWFVGLATDDPIWDITNFTNGRDRLLAADVPSQFLAKVIVQPKVRALLSAQHFRMDSGLLEAPSGAKRFLPWNRSGLPHRSEENARSLNSHSLQARLTALSEQLMQTEKSRDTILASASWRLTRPIRWASARMPTPSRRHARRLLKAAWWMATPWRMPQRIRVLRTRHEDRARQDAPPGTEALQQARPRAGALSVEDLRPDPRQQSPLDLFDGLEVQRACGLSDSRIAWPPQTASQIHDTWAAIRWIIDFLKLRPELRQRFPRALTDGTDGDFARWLAQEGGNAPSLSPSAKAAIAGAFASDPGARARQYYFRQDALRAAMPLGLLPPGRRDLAAWMLRHHEEGELRLEEVWWFLLQSAEDSAAELVQTYLFTPAWQQAHPYGLTPFGCDRLAAWIAVHHDLLDRADWLDPRNWPVRIPADEQIRLAYAARDDWREAHPNAFENERSARDFLTWLAARFSSAPGIREWCVSRLADNTAQQLSVPGANIIGHFCHPSGVRVSAEAVAVAIERTGGRVAQRDIRTNSRDDPYHTKYDGLEPHDVTIIHAQPEPFFDKSYALADLHERSPLAYRIAYWYWELETVPDHWAKIALSVSEIWTATRFVADALRPISPVPVRTMFPGVAVGSFTQRSRRSFGLPGREEGRFAFLFSFHMGSVMQRKNPLSLIRAFKQAFHPKEPVDLILKTTSFGHDDQVAELRQAAAGANIFVLDSILTPDETLSLIDACDAYVSLHRSEGLGLTMAEAMLLGKPVIATRYSGNLDFMDDGNSLLVDYKLVPVGSGAPPYDPIASWAEPSIDEASRLMRRVWDNETWSKELGQRARRDAEERLSLATSGERIIARLSEIKRARYRRVDRAYLDDPSGAAAP